MWRSIALAALCGGLLRTCAAQTFPGFQPSTTNTLFIKWNDVALNYSGEVVSEKIVGAFPELALQAPCNGTYLLVMVDPDAVGGNIETQDGLHTIHGNFTCGTDTVQLNSTTYSVLSSSSDALATFIPPEPQPAAQAATHRYTLLLFQQPSNFTIPSAFEYALPLNAANVTNRLDFDVQAFAKDLNSPLVAANTFDVISAVKGSNSTSGASPTASASGSASPTPSTSSTAAPTPSSAGSVSGRVVSTGTAFVAFCAAVLAL